MGLTSGLAGIAVLSPFTFVKGVSSPANFGLFFYVITIFPMMLAAVLYSLMAYLDLRNPNSPGNFTVKAGQTVTWVNKDTTVHTVTSSSGLFDSGNLNPGQTWSHDFTQSGVYKYYCTLHAWMKGNVT